MNKAEYEHISKIKPFDNGIQIFYMPKAKFIGKEIINTIETNIAGKLWEELINTGRIDEIKKLPAIIPDCLIGWSVAEIDSKKPFRYMVCQLCPYDTVVPKGYVYNETPASLVAVSKYGKLWDYVNMKVENAGMKNAYHLENSCWNGELYLDCEKDKKTDNGILWRSFIPCMID